MSIQVTCPGCHTRFSVSDKFAGKTGPCPKCKKTIQIPKAEDEVKVHEAESFGPKDSQGQSVLRPLTRDETQMSAIKLIVIVGIVVVAFISALAVRFSDTDPDSGQMWLFLVVGAALLAPLLAFGGYTFLRNQELEPHRGQNLWLRILICSAAYAALWLILPLVNYTVGDYDMTPVIIGMVIMALLGGGIGLVVLELDYLMGVIHFGLYLAACIIMRWVADLPPIPSVTDS